MSGGRLLKTLDPERYARAHRLVWRIINAHIGVREPEGPAPAHDDDASQTDDAIPVMVAVDLDASSELC